MKYPLSEMAQQLLAARYIHQELGEESWDDVVERVVNYIYDGKQSDTDREMLRERYFLPNSPTLVNAGTKIKGLSACFVVPLEDSLEDIAHTKYQFMKVAQKGGGCGTTLSYIRPKGLPVAGSTHSVAGGPISFYNTICEDMKAMTQAGFREMAMMGTMTVHHPDIKRFITAKVEEGAMHTSNLSVMITDNFMRALAENLPFIMSFYDDLHMAGNAEEIFDLIVHHAWLNGEPGVLFFDTINRGPYRETGQWIHATNPCGEQPLPPYGACNLGHIDVSKLYIKKSRTVDHWSLSSIAKWAVEFLDNAISKSEWPTPEIAAWVEANRPIGLGIMGFADLCLKMGYRYGDDDSKKLAKDIMRQIHITAKETSEHLGKERGIPEQCAKLEEPRRNITLTSIAPTGSVAMIAGCSHGIEPIFSPTYTRIDKSGSYEVDHPMRNSTHFVSAVNDDPDKVVAWRQHIDIQAAFQDWVDAGVSKTINLPNSATENDIREAIIYAWTKGCKGITFYRDGSRQVQVLNDKSVLDFEKSPVTIGPTPRRRSLPASVFKLKNGGDGNIYITVSFEDDKPYEIFVAAPSIDLKDVQMRDSVSRLATLALKWGVPVAELIKELKQIPAQSFKSPPHWIATVLEELYSKPACEHCGGVLAYTEGCATCEACGQSKCG
jgi:ribonucleoside-diphosphate reductase alpha chain